MITRRHVSADGARQFGPWVVTCWATIFCNNRCSEGSARIDNSEDHLKLVPTRQALLLRLHSEALSNPHLRKAIPDLPLKLLFEFSAAQQQ